MQTTQYINVFMMTALVVVLIVALSYFLKHFSQYKNNTKNNIKLASGLSLNNKNKLYIIEAFDKKFLIGATDAQLTVIHVEHSKRDDFEIVLSHTELLSEQNEKAI